MRRKNDKNLLNELKSSLRDTRNCDQISDDYFADNGKNFIDLLKDEDDNSSINQEMYDTSTSVEVYRNFLNWLFATFKIDEIEFRKACIQELGEIGDKKVLITSCGLGEDVLIAHSFVGSGGVVHAQDLSRKFVSLASEKCSAGNVIFTVSDALDLPYKDDYFDAVYHFGGINLFGDISIAISEMNRVCKAGGRVVFGDESVALHLRNEDYGKMFIENNKLWEETVPLEHIPQFADDINLKYVLGNCFYLLSFKKRDAYPCVDIDVEHIGYRGGSVRKRYFGKLEGVDATLKEKLSEEARRRNTSMSRILEDLIKSL